MLAAGIKSFIFFPEISNFSSMQINWMRFLYTKISKYYWSLLHPSSFARDVERMLHAPGAFYLLGKINFSEMTMKNRFLNVIPDWCFDCIINLLISAILQVYVPCYIHGNHKGPWVTGIFQWVMIFQTFGHHSRNIMRYYSLKLFCYESKQYI